MRALPHVSALVFDVFGRVVDWRSAVARDAARVFTRHGRPDSDPPHFADA